MFWKKTKENTDKVRPYLTFDGECAEAIELYELAFRTKAMQIILFSEIPPSPEFPIPAEYGDRVLQATLPIGGDYIRMSDCGPGHTLNDSESERISLAIEASVDLVENAFEVFAEEGRVGIPLAETFYSPCAGVVFDKFGVMWNLVGQNQ